LPNIDQIPQVLYEPTDPYYYLVDNVPLINILNKIELINDAVDIASDQLRDAVGSAGTLANRLESLNADGSINPNAIDSAMHNIGYHVDGIGPDSVPYVRMQDAERDKLATVADGATDIILQFDVQTSFLLAGSLGVPRAATSSLPTSISRRVASIVTSMTSRLISLVTAPII
jgi:hypothetical protein